jgi:hypothetical protein
MAGLSPPKTGLPMRGFEWMRDRSGALVNQFPIGKERNEYKPSSRTAGSGGRSKAPPESLLVVEEASSPPPAGATSPLLPRGAPPPIFIVYDHQQKSA